MVHRLHARDVFHVHRYDLGKTFVVRNHFCNIDNIWEEKTASMDNNRSSTSRHWQTEIEQLFQNSIGKIRITYEKVVIISSEHSYFTFNFDNLSKFPWARLICRYIR